MGVILVVHTNWLAAARGLIWPSKLNESATLTIVALFGTTISPYLFFWQSAQEAEEIVDTKGGRPLKSSPRSANSQFRRMRFDTIAGMAFSNIVSITIILADGSNSARERYHSDQYRFRGGRSASADRGQVRISSFRHRDHWHRLARRSVLAGSAAFAVSEAGNWKRGLEYSPGQAMRFYGVIAAATLIGSLFDWIPLDPVRALFWSAVLNGLVAVPIMVAMMILVSRRSVMGRFTASRSLLLFGWASTAVMAAAAFGLIGQAVLP